MEKPQRGKKTMRREGESIPRPRHDGLETASSCLPSSKCRAQNLIYSCASAQSVPFSSFQRVAVLCMCVYAPALWL